MIIKKLIYFGIGCFFITGCISAPPAKKISSSKTYQHQKAASAFDELDGKSSGNTEPAAVKDTPPVSDNNNGLKNTYDPSSNPEPEPMVDEQENVNYGSSDYLTAKGFGQSEFEAIRQAKAELSNIFEAKILSDVTSKTNQVTSSVKGSSYTKSIQSDIRIISNIQLEGVKISKATKENGEYVVIAALNKRMAVKKWLNDIKQIDTKIDVQFEKSNAAAGKFLKLKPLKAILRLWVEREVAISRLRVLGYDASSLRQHDLKSLLLQISQIKSSMLIDIDIAGKYGQTVRDLISKILTEQGFKVGDFESQSDILISGSVNINKVKNNNENFKFARAIVSLKIINSGTGKQVGQVSEDARGAHLNYDEASHRAVKKVSTTISTKLMELF